jgi:FtsH-binding integral membrane protein
VENEGDDSNFTVTLIGSEGLQISGNQTIFIESRKRASLTFNFTPHSLGQMYVVATVYWNKERLDTSLPLIFEVVEDFLIVLFRTLLVGLFSLLCGLLTVIIVRKKFKRSKNLAFMIGWGTISVTIFLTYILFIPTLKETVAQVVTIISTIVGIYTLILAITQKRS